MNYKEINDIERNYFKQDFTPIKNLVQRIRNCFIKSEESLYIKDLKLDKLLDYKGENCYIYITIFQEFTPKIRFGSKNSDVQEALNNCIINIKKKSNFSLFNMSDIKKTRILVEWETEKYPVNPKKIHTDGEFDETRFEPGINGLDVCYQNKWQNWLPTDSPVSNSMTIGPVFTSLAKRMKIGEGESIKNSEKQQRLKELQDAEFFITKSHAFISYKEDVIPLYRGNVLYKEFSYETLKKIIIDGNDWLLKYMKDNGQFMYYYNPTTDDNIDHEHPSRTNPDNLYYNDLRHAGGAISLLRAYEITGEEKYLKGAKNALDWSISILKMYKDDNNEDACYAHYNEKGKLGGSGVVLVALLRYRLDTKDECYDKYIEALTRHIISRLTPDGEFLGYYVHPLYNNGEPLIHLSDKERREMFSFYYPGEALLGLAMYINQYNKNDKLKEEVIEKSKLAMHWIINERPKSYSDLFTVLPSDAWLMQAIEEFGYMKDCFLEPQAIDFCINDAFTMGEKSYKKDDSPYIDFEGGMYYNHGDHYFPDGARSEGLIAAYNLAKYLGKDIIADRLLKICKKAAFCEFQLAISDLNNFAHKNPEKSKGGLKFKSTRQWMRTDSVQHVACFFSRLYMAEHNTNNIIR